MKRFAAAAILSTLLLAAVPLRPLAHESPIDHVDRDIRIWVSGEQIFLRYQLQLSERAAMMQLQKMDGDSSGEISRAERDAFFAAFAEMLAPQLKVSVAEKPVRLSAAGPVELAPQFRQAYTFSGKLEKLSTGRTPGRLDDLYSRSYPGNYRWDGGKVKPAVEIQVVVSEAPKPVDATGHSGMLQLKFDIVVP